MGILFLILWSVKYFGLEVNGYSFSELSWGWVVMPIAMELWHQLLKPNNQ